MNGTFCARLLRLLPAGFAQSFYYRFLRRHAPRWPGVYESASLRFAPGCRMKLVPGDEVSGAIALTGVYELELTRFLIASAIPGGLLVDVGANLGYHSLLWAARGNPSLAVEASPGVFRLLQGNLAANPEAPVEAVNGAASDHSGTLRFDPSGTVQMGWGHVSEAGTLEVPCQRVDEILGHADRVRVLKIDAEGHDLAVLSGASGLIRKRMIDWIVFESNPGELDSPAGCILADLLQDAGYSHPGPLGRPNPGTGNFVSRLQGTGQRYSHGRGT